ncbi:MAG: SDR family oxidoreductase [Phycisphaeraceae bacterium]|nr:SDR family oxidoreductase [Phycisphaeraceae bacterium]MBX3367099.1 SDR family oxidoreductase [Phycisphaeraceae bacterium]
MSESSSPVAIVTGAGSGIGLATARILAAAGWTIVLAGRREQMLTEARDTLTPGQHHCVPTDVGEPESCAALIRHVAGATSRIDALINNAGYAPLTPIAKHTPDLVRQTFEINAIGPANLILAAWPHMASRKSGRIVNVSSIATVDPFPGFFAYAAAKASVELMVKSIAKEGASVGIKAFAVAPGAVETDMLRSIIPERSLPRAKALAPETVAQVIADCVLGTRDADNGRTILVPSP